MNGRRNGSKHTGCGSHRFGRNCGPDREEYSEHGRRFSGDRHDGGDREYGDPYEDGYNKNEAYIRPEGFYRARDGKIMGVCKGLARRYDLNVKFVRLGFILLAIFTGFWPAAGMYIVLGLVMKPEPVIPPFGSKERDFYSTYVSSRASALSRLKEKFDSIENRIRRMEDVVTSKEFDWERRFRS